MTKENPSGGIPGRGFPRRVYPARVIGVGLGFISVAGVFVSAGAPPWAWLLLILNGFVWPHIAFLSARHAADPSRAERHNLMIDALAGGFWVALMQFNMLPSALLLAMLSMDNMALGGMRLFLRGLLAHLTGIATGVLLAGWAPAPVTNAREILFCLPFLLIYPQLVGNITFTRTASGCRKAQSVAAHSHRRAHRVVESWLLAGAGVGGAESFPAPRHARGAGDRGY